MSEAKPRRFHRERRNGVIAAVAGFFIINASNFGECGGQAADRSCLVGDTVVTDEWSLLATYTPLAFGPVLYLVAALLPTWSQRMGTASQITMSVAALSIAGSGAAVLAWGAGGAAIVAFAVAGVGLVIAFDSWRSQPASPPTT